MTISYNINIPAAQNNPSNDQPLMQTNTNSTSQLIGIDHVTFNDAVNPNGYHTVIHQTLQGSDPAIIAGINQLYSKNVTVGLSTDTQLFVRSGLGIISQLTGFSAVANGWQQLGGIIIQWGQSAVLAQPANTTINFPRVFPNACFSVVITPIRNATNVDIVYLVSKATASFVAKNTSSGGITTINWMAIGN